MIRKRAERQRLRLQRDFGRFVDDEPIISVMTLVPVGVPAADSSSQPVAAMAGAVADDGRTDDRGHSVPTPTTVADRFPTRATTLVLTEAQLATTDIDLETGLASQALARFELSEIAGILVPDRSGCALLSFTDGSAVGLSSFQGVERHARDFYADVAAVLDRRS